MSEKPLKRRYWWLKSKERKFHFRFLERRFLAAINFTGSAEGALVPVLLRITHWPKSGLPVSPPGLFPPCSYHQPGTHTWHHLPYIIDPMIWYLFWVNMDWVHFHHPRRTTPTLHSRRTHTVDPQNNLQNNQSDNARASPRMPFVRQVQAALQTDWWKNRSLRSKRGHLHPHPFLTLLVSSVSSRRSSLHHGTSAHSAQEPGIQPRTLNKSVFLSNHVVCRWFPLTSGFWWRHFRLPWRHFRLRWRHFRLPRFHVWLSGTRTQHLNSVPDLKMIFPRGQVTWYKIRPSDWSKFEILQSDMLGCIPPPCTTEVGRETCQRVCKEGILVNTRNPEEDRRKKSNQ